MTERIGNAELIVNPDGSIYHLHLKPEEIADTVIVVGDSKRVDIIASYFEFIELERINRDFHTITGIFNGKKLTAMSSGIGTDNIDIVLNEVDALANIDLSTKIPKQTHKQLDIIRLGTSGGLQRDIPVNAFVASTHGLGFDGLIHFYKRGKEIEDTAMSEAFVNHTAWPSDLSRPYFVEGSAELLEKIGEDMVQGITATSPGFYGPQGRALRLDPFNDHFLDRLSDFEYHKNRVVNFEMETSALYGMCKLLGHRALTVCVAVANRPRNEFSVNYPEAVDKLIKLLLRRLTQ